MSARKRAVDDDARNRDEVAALKASLADVELDLRSEVEKREAAERALRRSAQKGPGSVDEVRKELQSVKEAARTAFGAVRTLRARSPIRSPEADPERAFYSREARRDARRAASARLDVAERSLAPDASVSRRASVSPPPRWTGRRAARLDAVEPVLRPATSPDLSDESSEAGDEDAPFATPVGDLQEATDAFARLLASAEGAVATADQPRDLESWGCDRRSLSAGTEPVRPRREHAPSPAGRRVTRNVVVSPSTVVDAARIQRARVLEELCYTIPGSTRAVDRRRADRFAAQFLGVAAA